MASNLRSAVVLLLLLGGACGGDKKDIGPGIPPGNGDAGPLPDGGSTDMAQAGAGAVDIQILAPQGMAILPVAQAPEVRARIHSLTRSGTASSDPILPESVRFFVATDDPKAPAINGPLTGPSFNAEYAGRADLSSLPTGRHFLAVTAATRGGSQGAARIEVLVDAGPKITVLSPRNQGAYKGSTTVDLAIDATPFELADMPQAFVGTKPVTLEPGDGPGRYRGIIEFNKFDPPLIDDQLFRVVARNRQGTTAEAGAVFFVDDDGPLFAETLPREGTVVGGVVRISARIEDRAGVLGPSVVAFIGNRGGEGFELELRPETGAVGRFSALFDTRKLSDCKRPRGTGLCVVWPNLSFRASDLLGNERVVAYDIAIDNQPPIADLDPPDMRLSRFEAGAERCSWSFNPLGRYRRRGDMPDDMCTVSQVFDLRARVEDMGNWAGGLKFSPVATVEPMSVIAYILDDTSQPLSVDVDGDDICDAVNPKLIPTTMPPVQSNEVMAVRLVALAPTGSADFTPDPSLLMNGSCPPGVAREAPAPLCSPQDLTVTLGYYRAGGPEPSIWAIEPIDQPWCVGGQLDLYANELFKDGWACISVTATDRVGNSSVSHPLRVYVDRSGRVTSPSCPAPELPPPPDCTGRYDRATNAIVPGTCKGEKFAAGEIRAQ